MGYTKPMIFVYLFVVLQLFAPLITASDFSSTQFAAYTRNDTLVCTWKQTVTDTDIHLTRTSPVDTQTLIITNGKTRQWRYQTSDNTTHILVSRNKESLTITDILTQEIQATLTLSEAVPWIQLPEIQSKPLLQSGKPHTFFMIHKRHLRPVLLRLTPSIATADTITYRLAPTNFLRFFGHQVLIANAKTGHVQSFYHSSSKKNSISIKQIKN